MNVKSSVIQGESFETTQKRKKDHMKETYNELALQIGLKSIKQKQQVMEELESERQSHALL